MIDIEVSRWEEEGGAAQPEQREVFRGVLALMEQREDGDQPKLIEVPIFDLDTLTVTGTARVEADVWWARAAALQDLAVGEPVYLVGEMQSSMASSAARAAEENVRERLVLTPEEAAAKERERIFYDDGRKCRIIPTVYVDVDDEPSVGDVHGYREGSALDLDCPGGTEAP